MIDPALVQRITIVPRYCETDQMGVVYHARYLDWLEVGRTSLFRDLGLPYRELEARGIHLPVLEAQLRWLKPARYDRPVEVETRVERFAHGLVDFRYWIREGDDPLLRAGTKHMFTRDGRRLPLSLEDLKRLFDEGRPDTPVDPGREPR